MRIKKRLTLSEEELSGLWKLCEREERTVDEEIRFLLRRELIDSGFMKDTSVEPVRDASRKTFKRIEHALQQS
jgi:hypothetical protein